MYQSMFGTYSFHVSLDDSDLQQLEQRIAKNTKCSQYQFMA